MIQKHWHLGLMMFHPVLLPTDQIQNPVLKIDIMGYLQCIHPTNPVYPIQILDNIEKYLKYTINEDGSCQFLWSLIYFKSTIFQA